MALPKRRTPVSKRKTRQSHDSVILPNLVRDPATGGVKINHTAGGARDAKGRLIERGEA